ncbi:P-loop NTPase [Stigmatella hybrida]|uniref:P-loop NTPase n=1 Tax=Stigmatella hybrida TaxID=394097 RepID=UPI001CDA8278|nr:hypothetical protein [Stigmatella hybrida]
MDKEAGQHVFRLEGHEDLDILDLNGRGLEIIQLKAHGDALTPSELEPKKPDSFFHRVLRRRDALPDARERIVSFGPYGQEMLKAWNGQEPSRGRVLRQFEAWGYTPAQAAQLLSRVTLDSASERQLTDAVFEVLKSSFAGYDPSSAFALLHAWLFQVAELRKSITQKDLRERLTEVGRFLANRAAHQEEWFTAITPLEDRPVAHTEDLGEEFYQGVSARYEHILAGVDVVRRERLEALEQAFGKARVVVVRGASGQGKSALAHRFLHDYVPSASRFKVNLIQDRRHALSIARAVIGHLSALGALAYIYVDVAPGDTAWTDLVEALYAESSSRVLVTIREEDWLRASIGHSSLRFEEIALQLDEAEARLIHGRLIQRRPFSQYLDFEEAWERFGGRGPLLEFTYLLTQHDTLRARLEIQVLRLRERAAQLGARAEAELELLRRVSVASAYGARLDVVQLARSLALPEPQFTVQRLEREYLVRADATGRFVDGLHPVRSLILVSLLTDATFNPWLEVAVRALPQIVEDALGVFLLHAFSRQESERSRLAREIVTMRTRTWVGTAQVFRALLWLGVCEYVARNESVTSDARKSFGSGWFTVMFIDAGEVQAVTPGLSFTWGESLDFIPEEAKRIMRELRARLSPTRQLFSRAREWLAATDGSLVPPGDAEGWAAVAECLFWAARLDVRLPGEQSLLDAFEAALDSLPLNVAADVSYALSFQPQAQVYERLTRLRSKAIGRVRRESQIFKLEANDTRIAAHFLMAPAFIARREPESATPRPLPSAEKPSPNREAVRRARLLRSFLPGRQMYATQGYGHRFGLLAMEYDDTEKELDAKYGGWRK